MKNLLITGQILGAELDPIVANQESKIKKNIKFIQKKRIVDKISHASRQSTFKKNYKNK